MKTEKIDPDPFPPPCWKAPVTGVDESLALGGLNTQKSERPAYVRTFLNRSTSLVHRGIPYAALRQQAGRYGKQHTANSVQRRAKRRNVIMWNHNSILLKSKENDRIRAKNEPYNDC